MIDTVERCRQVDVDEVDETRRASVDGYASVFAYNVTMIPKANQHIYEPKYICD